MIGETFFNKKQVVAYLFVNCERCEKPLVTEKQRIDGFCEECFGLTDEDIELINRYDPYGQPILDEVPA